jgi:hypothetical protein
MIYLVEINRIYDRNFKLVCLAVGY